MTDWPIDYRTTLESAVCFERPGTGIVRVAGPDAARFLHNISSNDLLALKPGDGCESYFLDHRAKVLHRVRVVCESAESLLLDTDAGRGAALFAHLDKFLISERVELTDESDTLTAWHVAGPSATALVPGLESLREFQSRVHGGCTIRRHDTLGVAGFDVLGTPVAIAALQSEWPTLVHGTAATWDTLRIEALAPVAGVDYDESRFVLELPRAARGISYTKGCFPGQEPIVMSRDRAGFVNRALLGVAVEGTASRGDALSIDGRAVGTITSVTVSPRLQSTLALAYIQRGFQEPGTRFTLASGATATAIASPLPS